jgi:hypothetical protein
MKILLNIDYNFCIELIHKVVYHKVYVCLCIIPLWQAPENE